MKNKSWWGVGIVVSFIVFGVCILAVVYIAVTSKVDLVADDYYAKELKYQDHIDVMKETGVLEKNIEFSFAPASVNIHFPRIAPPAGISGAILFFRPSDKGSDFTTNISIDSSYTQHIATANIPKGMWKVKVSWNAGSKQYYFEQPVVIQ